MIAGADPDILLERADRIGALVALENWAAIQPGLAVSVSVGAAAGSGPSAVDDLYPRANAALYAAKPRVPVWYALRSSQRSEWVRRPSQTRS